MRPICYSVAMSLDGYVAGPNGENDWIVMDAEMDFASLMSRFDTVLMGRKTFEMSRKLYGSGSMPGVEGIVVSKTLESAEFPDVKIIGGDLENELIHLRKSPGKEIWLFGGGILFRSLLTLGQVQTVEVAIIPVLLGSGVPFLPAAEQRKKLKLASNKIYRKTGTVALTYEVASGLK